MKPPSLVFIELIIRQAKEHPRGRQEELRKRQIEQEKQPKHAGFVCSIDPLSGQTPCRLQKGKTINNESNDSGISKYGGSDLIIRIAKANTKDPIHRGKTAEDLLGVLIRLHSRSPGFVVP